MDGVLNVHKPTGPTSHDVVNRIRRIFSIKRVGHAGTLDPMASGVLVVCLGKATRIVEYLTSTQKEYKAVLTLGITTDTQDSTGSLISQCDASNISVGDVRRAACEFIGEIEQVPPMISAIKYQGKPLYKHAREGRTIERQARLVTIYSIGVGQKWICGEGTATRDIELTVGCSAGTYIRTLCADIGEALGCGGVMSSLRRTRVGQFGIDNAVSLEKLQQAGIEGRLLQYLTPMSEALADMPGMEISEIEAQRIEHGMPIGVDTNIPTGEPIRLTNKGNLLAIGMVAESETGTTIQPRKVFL